MSVKQIAVIGLGRVGLAACQALGGQGYDVIAIDDSRDRVQELVDDVPGNVHLVMADSTDIEALRELQIGEVGGAIVAIGDNVEANVLTSMNLVELNTPRVIARASGPTHAQVLRRIGVDEIYEPPRHAGRALARMAASRFVVDLLELEGDEALVEAEVPEEWIGKSLAQLKLTDQGLTVLVHKRGEDRGNLPHGDQVLERGDRIVVGGNDRDLRRSLLFVTPGR